MNMITKIRKMTADVIEDVKWPFRQKAIARAADALIDGAELKKMTTDQKLIDLRKKLTECESEDTAKSILKQIIDVQIELEASEKIAKLAQDEKAYLFGASGE